MRLVWTRFYMEPARGSWLPWKHMHFSICQKRSSFDPGCASLCFVQRLDLGWLLTALNTLKSPACQSLAWVLRGWRILRLGRRTICFLPSWSTLLLERGLGEEGRFGVASRSETSKTSCQNHKQQLLRPRIQWPKQSSTYPNNPGERTASFFFFFFLLKSRLQSHFVVVNCGM